MQQIGQLFTDYYPKFIRYANSYLEDETVAEDVVMDSFMYYIENKEIIAPVANLPAYLLTIIKNKCLNSLRAKRIRSVAKGNISYYDYQLSEIAIATLEACDPFELFSDEVTRIVDSTVDSLPERTKEIFVKNRHRNMSYKEIAEEMRLSVKTVEKEISKALKVLRVALKDYLPALFFL